MKTYKEQYNEYKDYVKTHGIKGVCKTCLHKKTFHFIPKLMDAGCRIVSVEGKLCKCGGYRKSANGMKQLVNDLNAILI